MKEVKCEHCQFWTDGHQTHCSYCGGLLHAKQLAEKEALEKVEFKGMPLLKINPDDPFIKRGFMQVVRFIQLIFFAFISSIAAMAGSTVH